MNRVPSHRPRLALSAPVEEHGCYERRHWRCDLETDVEVAVVEADLSAGGWRIRCLHPNLRSLRHPEGHEIAWVLPTGRIQIRVDADVPPKRRRATATSLWGRLADAFDRATESVEEYGSSRRAGS